MIPNADRTDDDRGQSGVVEKKPSVLFWLCAFLVLLLTVFCFVSVFHFFIPFYLNTRLIPSGFQNMGLTDAGCEVRRIGLSGSDIAGLRIGSEEQAAISVRSVHIDYSPGGLVRKRIDRIRLSGIELHCVLEDGNLTLRGLDPDMFAKSEASSEKAPPSFPLIPISVGRAEIRNATIICEWNETSFRLPFELEITPRDASPHILESTLKLYPRGQQISFRSDTDLLRKTVRVRFQSASIDMGRWADFFIRIPGLVLAGTADIRGDADIQMFPFRMRSFSALFEFHDAGSRYGSLILQQEKKNPLVLEIQGNEDEWQAAMSSLLIAAPVPLRVSSVTCRMTSASDPAEISGSFKAGLEESASREDFPADIRKPIALNGNFSGKIFQNGDWEFWLNNSQERSPCRLRIANADVQSESLSFDISAKRGQAQNLVKYQLAFPRIRVRTPSATAEFALASVTGTGGFGDALRFDSLLTLSDGDFSSSGFRINGLSSRLPVTWPWKETRNQGKFSAKALQWNQTKMGSLSGTIQQNESGFAFQAAHRSSLISDLVAGFDGECRLFSPGSPEADIRFSAHHKKPADIHLEKLLPAAKGLALHGKLEAQGHLVANGSGTTCSLNTRLTQATVLFQEKDISVQGLQAAFSMPDVFALHSAPKQEATFEKAAFGGLSFTDGSIAYQLEPGGSFFIEKGRIGWCDGNIHLHSLRISPGNEDYDLILYCDRLNLAEILDQLGAARADGEGAVNGRIPVRLKNGKISFSDGFLFSTPGDGGTIHVTGAEMLTEGIPKDTPQYTQIDLAREALKDYTYKWAKLRLVTQGEELQLKLQFDGKPANPLPFVYEKEIGGFVRVGAESKGSHFQGIRLDVNMGLPLDEILQYQHLFRK